ncbi:NAD-dependent epimerase/dehydratase family protein [Candidatus Woesearchaeota archaeon]|nr:NAD-dependent epimerase/dehydratase family protein [Candidatus Woesearchaeota archaeon]
MTILVTGGAGFIGSHVADALIEKGHDVIVLDDLSGGFKENINPKAIFIEGSITDYELIKRIFSENSIEYVFHIAAYAAEGLSHFIRRFNYENNLKGSINLINQSVLHNVKCFVFTSSIAVYGAHQLPMTEDITPEPEDPYGISKLAVEYDLKSANHMFGLNYIIFRAHNVYGTRQNLGDKYRNVIGIFMNQIMQGKPMTIFGDGEQRRAFSYIGDVAPVIASSVDNKDAYNQVFNIGADTPYTVNHLADVVRKTMGSPQHPIIHLDARKEVKDAYSQHEKVKRILGYKNTVELDEGIKRMAEWAKKTGIKKSREFENIEIKRNLPWK